MRLIMLAAASVVDFWALGVIMFYFLTGRLPFAAFTNEEIMHNILVKGLVEVVL